MVVKKQLELFGKKIRTDKGFKKQTGIDRFDLASYKREQKATRIFYDRETEQILKIDIKKQNPRNIKKNDGILLFQSWRIQRVNNKKIIKADEIIKTMGIFKNLNFLYENNATIKLFLTISYEFPLSDEFIVRSKTYIFNNNISELYNYIKEVMEVYLDSFPLDDDEKDRIIDNTIDNKRIKIQSDFLAGDEFQYDYNIGEMKLREEKPFIITNLFNNIIKIKQPKNKNCVKEFLKIYYKKISNTTIDKLGNKKGVSSYEIKNFCKDYSIKCLLYDIEGNIITSHYPEKKNKSYKSLVGISYSNHLYPLKNQQLSKVRIPVKIEITNDTDDRFRKILLDSIIPSNIAIRIDSDNKIKVSSFEHDKVKYIYNNDYETCVNILNTFGLKDNITPYTNLKNISKILESYYIKENTSSFLPIEIIKGGYNYINDNINHEENFENYITIDHNKFYSNCLHRLNYLITCDIRQDKVTKFKENPESIIEHYLYIAKPKQSNILIPNKNVYTGEFLCYCLNEGVEFDILEEIETTRVNNYYKNMIEDIYSKVEHTISKEIMNITIGKFEMMPDIEQKIFVSKVCNLDERRTDKEGLYLPYATKNKEFIYLKIDKDEKVKNLLNKKPIAVQIKDNSRKILYEKLIELELDFNDIIAIETDSITFNDKDGKYKKIMNKEVYNSRNWKGWKIINKELDFFQERKKYMYEEENNISFILENEENNNTLFNCYAGAGKTHKIINELIPKLKDDYLIVTPCHNASKTYYKQNLNCKVVQTFKFDNCMPKENNIIVDEIGLCDRDAQNFIYKCKLLGKTIYSFGDFRQLLPINNKKHFNSENYINHLYKKVIDMQTNYRNNFTIEYYNSLINSKSKIYLTNEVKKYRDTDYTKSDIIICITNEEKKIYNDLMCKYLKIKDICTIGAKIICNSNDLRNKNIYNNFDFTIEKIEDDLITLDTGDKITQDELKKNFEFGYSITLFKAQGQEFNSFYIPDTSLEYLNSRSTYTIISRLKQELSKETIKRNNTHTIKL